jgi:hypothetical protein
MKIKDPLDVADRHNEIVSVLIGIASQENCDGEPYDQIVEAYRYIWKLEEITYKLARLVRGTDTIAPTTRGRMMGDLLVQLRNLDVEMYDKLVLKDE